MIKKMVITIGFSLILSGCATFTPPWEEYQIKEYNYEPHRSYELGKKYNASVGDTLISAYKGTLETYYKPLIKDAIIWGGRSVSSFDNGSKDEYKKWVPKYKFDGEDGDYILTSKAFHKGVIGIIANDNGSIPPNPIMRLDNKGSIKRFPIVNASESNLLFRKTTQMKDVKGNFKFELLYTGKTNNSIHVVYREYVDDLARNSFYQNLTYDLNESDIIRFKSIEIEIIKSTNSELVFKVLKDDNLNWVP
ncbi:hypothetical protein [Vibrio anguillarum]|uniref:hypothetical protein n=1 Tax=Vibrio anguillarum TaxID=55601 RepID=UPI0018FF0B48|nr:hypothetical protein [Vibrio anguillarum]MBF4425588.1 hypothetical protein [Vibrio anguillarum]